MQPNRLAAARLALVSAATLAAALTPAHATVPLTLDALSYSQDFDTLPRVNGSDPAWTNDATLPGWYLFAGRNLDGAVSNLRVSTSSGSDRAHISYGTNNATDRALGSQGGSTHRYSPASASDGETFGAIAVAFVNASGVSMDGFSFGYVGEQWHVSSNANVAHSLTMAWAVGAPGAAFNTLPWQSFSALQANPAGVHFVSPTVSGGVSGNGNLAANRTEGLGATVQDIHWAPGDLLWLRWVDLNDPASDHGLAIDDFFFTASPVPAPAALWTMLAGLGLLAPLMSRRRRDGDSRSSVALRRVTGALA
jgi:hypothetical protein